MKFDNIIYEMSWHNTSARDFTSKFKYRKTSNQRNENFNTERDLFTSYQFIFDRHIVMLKHQ
jgi:hypothetical protein